MAVALLLAVHFFLAVSSKFSESTTSDEIAHLTGGITYWELDDYRFQPENGNLPQRWAAIPAVVMGTQLPPIARNSSWSTSDVWEFGHQLFYETNDDHFIRLTLGRAMIALFSVGIGLLVFCWSRRIFGLAGGFVSLVFFVFCPSFLAHGALVTSDACMAFFLLATVGLWWRHLHDGKSSTLVASALVFGIACLAKFSAVLLIPIFILIGVVRLSNPKALVFVGRSYTNWKAKIAAMVGSSLVHAVAAIVLIWAAFGFRYSGFNPKLPHAFQYIRSFPMLVQSIGIQGSIVGVLASLHALPEAFLYGYSYVVYMNFERATFLNGDYSIFGWRSYFFWAFFYKNTIPFMGACLLALGVAVSRWRRGLAGLWKKDLYRFTPLLVLFLFYWFVSVFSHLNIGERHILPTYPVLMIGLGALGSLITRNRLLATSAVLALIGWHAGEALMAYPNYIAYFNETVGGPNGYKVLSDSSVDWGQDLPGLKLWLTNHQRPGEQAYLSYFGTGEPDYYQLKVERLPFINGFHRPDPYQVLGPGLYCIGGTMLDQAYGTVRGPWNIPIENDYQRLKASVALLTAKPTDPKAIAQLNALLPAPARSAALRRFLGLRLARLTYYLRVKKPDAVIGNSIFVFRLNAQEVHAATEGTLKEWSTLIEHAQDAGAP